MNYINFMRNILVVSFVLQLSIHNHAQEMQTKVEPFMPDVISRFPAIRDLAISPDGNEAYFTIQSYLGEISSLIFIKKDNGTWSKPEVPIFCGKYQDMEPSFSPDGLKLFFASNRPIKDSSQKAKDFDIWFVERKDLSSHWSNAINIGSPINSTENEFYPSITKTKNLYFTSDGANSKGKDDIFVSKWVDGKYQPPASLSDSINSAGYEFNAFVSPNESYLLFTCYNRKDGFGSGDLYISYNKGDSQWTSAKNLGKGINSPQMDYCPFVQVQQGILYFTSRRSELKSEFETRYNLDDILKEINKYENGLSRLYKIELRYLIDP